MMHTIESGLLNIFKPSGVTSFWVVKEVRRTLGVKKVGHCGTLDAPAEGVLLVLFGAATRLQAPLMALRKTYRTKVRFGLTTDTGDMAGKVLTRAPAFHITQSLLKETVQRFIGDISQVPPMYSALKVGGKRLYHLARRGETIERSARTVHVYGIDVLSFEGETAELRVECSRGTYIRTLAEDIGAALGCGAAVEYLLREKIGPFDRAGSIDGRTIRENGREDLLGRALTLEQARDVASGETGEKAP